MKPVVEQSNNAQPSNDPQSNGMSPDQQQQQQQQNQQHPQQQQNQQHPPHQQQEPYQMQEPYKMQQPHQQQQQQQQGIIEDNIDGRSNNNTNNTPHDNMSNAQGKIIDDDLISKNYSADPSTLENEQQNMAHETYQNLVMKPGFNMEENIAGKLEQQNLFCQQKAKQFFGRRKLLMDILQLIDGDEEDDDADVVIPLGKNDLEPESPRKKAKTPREKAESPRKNSESPPEKPESPRKEPKAAEEKSESPKEKSENSPEKPDSPKKEPKTPREKVDNKEEEAGNGEEKNNEDVSESKQDNKGKNVEKVENEEENLDDDQVQDEKQKGFNPPIFIHGKSGSGVSSIMAKTAVSAKSESPNRVLVSRFVGCGGAASTENIFEFIYGICYQLKRAFGEKVPPCPKVSRFTRLRSRTMIGMKEGTPLRSNFRKKNDQLINNLKGM